LKHWIIRHPDQMRKVAGQLLGLDLGHPLEVKVEEYKPRRTLAQNSLLWKWHTEVAADLTAYTKRHWTPEAVHYEIFCKRFLGGEVVKLPDGTKSWHAETSSKQTKQKLSDAMTEYHVWCINNEINLTMPEDSAFNQA